MSHQEKEAWNGPLKKFLTIEMCLVMSKIVVLRWLELFQPFLALNGDS